MLDRMIDQTTGELDVAVIREAAELRAAREFGSPNFPPAYLREAMTWCEGRAEVMRRQWRRAHSLPDDMVLVPFTSFAPDTNE